MSGFEAARHIRDRNLNVAKVILSTHSDEQFLKQAKEYGAQGFVDKNNAADQPVRAVNAVADGQEFFF
jgi:two-component system nitrate/nitrite response regulator NarL